jgi:hypothetical protein
MLITLFRSSYLPQYLLLILIAILLWLPAFLDPPPLIHTDYSVQPLYNIITGWLINLPLTAVIIGFVLTIIQSLVFNMVLISHGLVSKNSMIPAIVLVAMMSCHYQNLTLTPIILAGFLLVALLNIVFSMYEKTDNIKDLLSAGFLVSFSSMIYFPSIFLLLFILYVLIIYRIVTWREWVVPFIGFIIPFLYLWTYYLWTDELNVVYVEFGRFFSHIFNTVIIPDVGDIIVEGWLILLILLPAFVKTITSLNSYNIISRKKLSVSNWFLVITIVITLAYGNLLNNNLFAFGGAIVAAHFFDVSKRSAWNEIVLLLFVLAAAVNNFF